MRNGSRVTMLAVLLSCAIRANAAEVEPCAAAYDAALKDFDAKPEQVWPLINGERQSGCILGATDTTGVRALYLDLQTSLAGVDRAVKRAQLFDRVTGAFADLPSSVCDGNSTACVVGRHVHAIRQARELLNAGAPDLTDQRLSNSQWTIVVAFGTVPISNVDLRAYLIQQCREGSATPDCRRAVEVAAKILRSTEATFQAISAHAKPIIDANAAFLSMNDREWASYFNDVSVQYPWELALNSWRFQRQVPQDARARFPRAPESKLIALHPAPAFEYAKVGNDRGTQAAVVVELIGYERWQWREGAASNRVGVSLAASFSDVPGADAIGYGLVFRTPIRNFSIGAIWRDSAAGDSVNLIFNLDISGLLQHYEDLDVTSFINAP
jgi:hypothetical protein